MPWDPANFSLNFSFNKQQNMDPTTEYENTNDYRGSFQYAYSPYIKGLKPLGWIKSNNKNLKFFKEWELNYLPNSITFLTTMSRYYYEQQTRSEVDVMFQLPVSVSKNFSWDRQFSLTWNLTKSLNLSLNTNTSARIDEPMGAVNKQLFPDEYKLWKDTVLNSITNLGTPWSYNQSFVASYKAPFNKIPFLDFLTASASYNATYNWEKGAIIEGIDLGNTVKNQSSWNIDGRLNLETLYNKVPYLKEVNKKFASTKRSTTTKKKKAKKFERTFKLMPDTTITIKHNLRNKKVKVVAKTTDGKPFAVKTKTVDANTITVLTHGDQNIKFTITEDLTEDKNIWKEMGDYTARFAMLIRNGSVRWRNTQNMSLPLFRPQIGDAFGQTTGYGPMSPGLDFAFGFTDESYIDRAKERGWLICDDTQTSPAIWSKTNELNVELNIEPFKGFKIQLTSNRTDNRTNQIQFMYDNSPISRSGSYTKTHVAIATALRSSSADNGYNSTAFNTFLDNIPVIAGRLNSQYRGTRYPENGFMSGHHLAGAPYDPEVGGINTASSDVLIPAFIAAYTGKDASTIYLDPFPSFAHVLPNWRVTYDGLVNLGKMKKIFKTFSLKHAYQCTYSVGSYSSFLNWISADGDFGFTLDELTGQPVPSSPYNISSVAITEKFAPLIGVNFTLKNELNFNAEYRDSRTLTLNSGAGQLVEAATKGLTVGAGYKIVGFNSVLKLKKSQGISNDLTINADFSYQESQALIRRIEDNYAQATSGTRGITINMTASYVMSKRMTIAAFFDHQVNTPLVSTSSYPTSNSSYGITLNLNLAR
jgi:cell surface protein SprA